MSNLLPLPDALEKAAEFSDPREVLTRSETFLKRASELSGVSVSELQEMNTDGSLDKFLSERFYFLALVALGATLEAIEDQQIPPESLYRIATESSKMAQKLAGRDIQKKYIVNADIWEHAAADVIDSEAN